MDKLPAELLVRAIRLLPTREVYGTVSIVSRRFRDAARLAQTVPVQIAVGLKISFMASVEVGPADNCSLRHRSNRVVFAPLAAQIAVPAQTFVAIADMNEFLKTSIRRRSHKLPGEFGVSFRDELAVDFDDSDTPDVTVRMLHRLSEIACLNNLTQISFRGYPAACTMPGDFLPPNVVFETIRKVEIFGAGMNAAAQRLDMLLTHFPNATHVNGMHPLSCEDLAAPNELITLLIPATAPVWDRNLYRVLHTISQTSLHLSELGVIPISQKSGSDVWDLQLLPHCPNLHTLSIHIFERNDPEISAVLAMAPNLRRISATVRLWKYCFPARPAARTDDEQKILDALKMLFLASPSGCLAEFSYNWRFLFSQMADGGFRGTNVEQDTRFADKQKKLLKSLKFPPSFSQKASQVDMSKVNISVIKPWITTKVTTLLGFEDELLINYIFEMLQPTTDKPLDPKQLQINLTEFLDAKQAPAFVVALWDLLLSAQESVGGIPRVFLEEKMKEVAKIEADKARIAEELKRRAGGAKDNSSSSSSAVAGPAADAPKTSSADHRDGDRSAESARQAENGRAKDDRSEYTSSGRRRDDRDDYDREKRRHEDDYKRKRDDYDARRSDSYSHQRRERDYRERDYDERSKRRGGDYDSREDSRRTDYRDGYSERRSSDHRSRHDRHEKYEYSERAVRDRKTDKSHEDDRGIRHASDRETHDSKDEKPSAEKHASYGTKVNEVDESRRSRRHDSENDDDDPKRKKSKKHKHKSSHSRHSERTGEPDRRSRSNSVDARD
ncbi:Serine/arginine repetitive matrix protein 1 [Entophlyctis luteolus]|nr:Serine/arginine repetitive matrix protein 1 [Entophlyctis luteolus]